MKTVCIEKRGTLGGTCLNVGCIPSKALLNSTHKFHEAQHDFAKIGIMTGEVKMDFPQLMKSKEKAVGGLTSGIEYLFKNNKVDYMKGWGKFASANAVDVDMNDGSKDQVTADNIIIATGSEPASLPDKLGLIIDEEYVVTSTGALDLKKIPKSMVVVGGGVIGLEMGSVYQRLGCQVTVIQHTEIICPFLDREVAKEFMRILKKQGIKFELNTRVMGGENHKDKGVKVNIESKDGKQRTLDTDVCLLSIGRRPFTGGL
jgi:dihydrolipoamide dehydrogenase